ncbi:Abi family protein [Sporosarcina sp. FA9]|uniref:Abi family protein n=1 Tax=Sporosarcina sp. FA9 TaxID=3413030 RepID=UPI003F65B14B
MTEKIHSEFKKKLNFDEMIEHLVDKNVKFDIINQESAKSILQNSNYFYKITAYRKNFYKNKEGKYLNLEFCYLSDLATIDMRLRYIILHMSLDIEHRLKTKILTDITNDPYEDGYNIVKEFLIYTNSTIDRYFNHLKYESHYNHGIYTKHGENPPIWVLFEIMSFGDFVKFVEFYYKDAHKSDSLASLCKVLRYVKNVRNLAAHNSPLIMDVVELNQLRKPIVKPITSFVQKVPGISKDMRRKRLSNRKVHDLTALLFVYDMFIDSQLMKETRYKSLNEILERCLRYKDHYKKHNGLVSVYKYFSKIVDFIDGKAYHIR